MSTRLRKTKYPLGDREGTLFCLQGDITIVRRKEQLLLLLLLTHLIVLEEWLTFFKGFLFHKVSAFSALLLLLLLRVLLRVLLLGILLGVLLLLLGVLLLLLRMLLLTRLMILNWLCFEISTTITTVESNDLLS